MVNTGRVSGSISKYPLRHNIEASLPNASFDGSQVRKAKGSRITDFGSFSKRWHEPLEVVIPDTDYTDYHNFRQEIGPKERSRYLLMGCDPKADLILKHIAAYFSSEGIHREDHEDDPIFPADFVKLRQPIGDVIRKSKFDDFIAAVKEVFPNANKKKLSKVTSDTKLGELLEFLNS